VYALNFYSSVFAEQLRNGLKTVTIRLGDKRDKYQDGQIVWLTVGRRFGPRKHITTAIIDQVEVKALSEVSPREIERDNSALRSHEDLVDFLTKIYGRKVTPEDTITVIHFSRVED